MKNFVLAIGATVVVVVVIGLANGVSTSPVTPVTEKPSGDIRLATKQSEENNVTVVVSPRAITPESQTVDFEITLDTHSVELDADLSAEAKIITDSGAPLAALSFEGDPPGGHHRRGVLRMPLPNPLPNQLVLVLPRMGAAQERVFTWALK